MCSLDQQQQHHLHRRHPGPANQETPYQPVITSPPGDSDAGKGFRATDTDIILLHLADNRSVFRSLYLYAQLSLEMLTLGAGNSCFQKATKILPSSSPSSFSFNRTLNWLPGSPGLSSHLSPFIVVLEQSGPTVIHVGGFESGQEASTHVHFVYWRPHITT